MGGGSWGKAMAYIKARSWTKIPRGPQVVVAMGRVVGEQEMKLKSLAGLHVTERNLNCLLEATKSC